MRKYNSNYEKAQIQKKGIFACFNGFIFFVSYRKMYIDSGG